jgi:hypothetical protein
MKKLPVYEMMIDEDMDSDLMVDFIALVDRPAIKKDFLKFSDKFVEPAKGERETEFMPRCISYVINEGKSNEQAVAICSSMWQQHFAEDKISFDFDDTLNTERGKQLAKNKIEAGAVVYIVSARHDRKSMFPVADELGIPHDRVFATGSNAEKIKKVLELGIVKHYDNNSDIISELGSIGEKFAVESWNDYPEAAVENAKTALRWAEENGWGDCGEATGKFRANQIASRSKLSRETIARMSAFQRHRQNSDRPLGDGCGRLMWLSWGGTEGIEWAERKLQQIDRKGFAIQDEDKRIISGPLMIANQKIFRTDPEIGDYEVYFSSETIKKIAIKMAKKGFHNNVNLMHNADMKVSGVTLFEVFQSDKTRGIRPMKGFEDLADGTLFGSMYVENPVAWQMIKDGFIKGFSVEGNFGMRKKDEYAEQFQKIVEILNSTTF